MKTLCLGEALVDLICERPVAALAEADMFRPHFGGAVANTAVSAARAGAEIALAGAVGDDPWGHWLRDRLAAERIDLEWFDVLEGRSTPIVFVTVTPGGEASYSLYGASIAAGIESLDGRIDAAVASCDALFLSTNTLVGERERELTLRARDMARERGAPIVFDPNLRLHRWRDAERVVAMSRDIMRDTLVVKANLEEARALTGESDPASAGEALVALGARAAVVTLGADGALVRGAARGSTAGVRTRVVSTMGAGDAFTGVLIAHLARAEFDPAATGGALREAVTVAARATEQWGAVP